jgi:hypothetical protein
MDIYVTIKATANEASYDTCTEFGKACGTWEVFSEGYRIAWADDEADAIEQARGLVGSDLTTTTECTTVRQIIDLINRIRAKHGIRHDNIAPALRNTPLRAIQKGYVSGMTQILDRLTAHTHRIRSIGPTGD